MFQEGEVQEQNSILQIDESALMNIEDEILPQHNRIDPIQGNPNNLLQTSMVGGVSQHNETTLFDEDFAAGFINEM